MNGGTTISNLSLTNTIMYGLKFGYYLDSMKWLGFETEIFNTAPQIKHQTVTSNGPAGSVTGTIPGGSLRVLTWAPVNVVVRYQLGKLEPYAGVGVGLFMANINDLASGTYSPNTAVGLNTQVGLRYFIIENLSLFGEWKYNRASFNFSGYNASPAQSTGAGYSGTYSANIFAFGVGYHFE
jgi:opacity protein-like surface antigen